MLATLIGVAIASCVSVGQVVTDRAEKALEKPDKKPLPSAQKNLDPLDARSKQFLTRTIDRARNRLSKEEALEEFSQIVEAYTDLLPKLAPPQVLVVLGTLSDLSERIESLLDEPPPDWPEETWVEFRRATGCESKGRGLLDLGVRYAKERGLSSAPLLAKIRRLEREEEE